MKLVTAAETAEMLVALPPLDLHEETEEALEHQRATIRRLSAELRALRGRK